MIPQPSPLRTFLGRALQRGRHLLQGIGFILACTTSAWAGQQDIPAPADSGGGYASVVVVLPNGNIVVTDPSYSPGGLTNAGAVYLLDGATLNVISTLVGSTTQDLVGVGDIIVLTNGNFVVANPYWDNGSAVDAGAVTWGSATTGFIGGGTAAISAANSLVGTRFDDEVGNRGVTALTNGNYVFSSPYWDNDAAFNAGAATWGDGSTGTVGSISATNSLVGSTSGQFVGLDPILALTNGNYAVSSSNAVTWGNGNGGTVGLISASNSLVGSSPEDRVGSKIVALTNGHYVVCSYRWTNGPIESAGAVTWCNGNGGTVGPVSATNSLVGSTAGDYVGYSQDQAASPICPLTNGNYVVCSPYWTNGTAMHAGAVTWCNGNGGTVGPVSTANSFVGSTANDNVGYYNIIPLSNGNYVFQSKFWDGAAVDAGAVTWGNGSGGTAGVVSAANSLVGSSTGDMANYGIIDSLTALTNGNYVVCNSAWDNGGLENAGAVTWGNGNGGTVGYITAANSLVGSSAGDLVGYGGVTALSNGNYVAGSSEWSGSASKTGAVTWGNGSGGTVGEISAANSLVGSTASDGVGGYMGISAVIALTNGSYVVASSGWDNGSVADVGAVTWGTGSTGIAGTVSPANSLIGATAGDSLGLSYFGKSVIPLPNDDVVIISSTWDNGAVADAGAVTWVSRGAVGTVSAASSVFGTIPFGAGMVTARNYDPVRNRLFVGRGDSKLLSILTLDSLTHLQSWRTQHFGTAANAGNAADTAMPQNDGVTNLMKFATGLNPALRSPQPGIMLKNGGSLEFTYPRSIDAMAECTFTVEWSDTLLAGSWNSTGVTESILSATSTLQQIKATLPAGAGSSRFVRLRVTTP